jgi:hypothetical protein
LGLRGPGFSSPPGNLECFSDQWTLSLFRPLLSLCLLCLFCLFWVDGWPYGTPAAVSAPFWWLLRLGHSKGCSLYLSNKQPIQRLARSYEWGPLDFKDPQWLYIFVEWFIEDGSARLLENNITITIHILTQIMHFHKKIQVFLDYNFKHLNLFSTMYILYY